MQLIILLSLIFESFHLNFINKYLKDFLNRLILNKKDQEMKFLSKFSRKIYHFKLIFNNKF